MSGLGLMSKYRVVVATMAATVGHVIIAALVLSFPRADEPDTEMTIPISFIVFPDPKLAVDPEVEPPVEVIQRRPNAAAPVPVLTVNQPPPDEAAPRLTETPRSTAGDRQVDRLPAIARGQLADQNQGGEAMETAAGIRQALRRLGCRNLFQRLDARCPRGDPVYEAQAIAALREAPMIDKGLEQAFLPSNFAEAFLARNRGWPPKMLGGEDNSIFIDPMAPGAYNADRIRKGEAPIWDADLERALRAQRSE